VNGVKEYQYFAGGEWRTAENRKLFDVFRPYDRGLYARVAAGGRPEAKLAVDAAAKGAKLHAGGVFEGQIYQPTILSNVSLDTAIANEETFGPVVVVEVVDTPEQAVEAANRTMYGLSSSILAGNTYRAFELAPKILAGCVNVNSPTVNDEIHAPMGGVRDSGWGRTGPDSLKEFQDVIWINSHSGQRQYPI
jgi:acyl-CoA reductase-like NAD-dependent aldehyde dehydrogenase